MALTLNQVREQYPELSGTSDEVLVNFLHKNYYSDIPLEDFSKAVGLTSGDEAGDFRSYVELPFLKGTAAIGGAVGYGLEASGIAPETGRSLQESHQRAEEALTERQSQQAREDASKRLIDDEGNYGGYNAGTFAQQLFESAPGMLAMGMPGGLLARGATAGAKAAGVGSKAANTIGSALGFGASEGIFSGASNAEQIQQEIRNVSFDKLVDHPAFIEAYHTETDPDAPQERRLEQARDILARKAGDEVFADTAVKTGGISALTGGGIFGMMREGRAGGLLANAGKGMLKEGVLQEAPQSALEQRTSNQARLDYLDPNQDLNEGVLTAGIEGGLVGAAMGVAGGAGVRDIGKAETVDDAIAAAGEALKWQPPAAQIRPDAEAIIRNRSKPGLDLQTYLDQRTQDTGYMPELEAVPWEAPSATVKPDADAFVANRTVPGKSLQSFLDEQTESAGYVPGEAGQVWEAPNIEAVDQQAQRNRAFYEAEQAAIARKEAELDAMLSDPRLTPNQQKQYRKARVKLEEQKRQRAADFKSGIGYNIIPNQAGAVHNTQLRDQLQGLLARGRSNERTGSDAERNPATPDTSPTPTGTIESAQTAIESTAPGKPTPYTHAAPDTGEKYRFLGDDRYQDAEGATWSFSEGELEPLTTQDTTNAAQDIQPATQPQRIDDRIADTGAVGGVSGNDRNLSEQQQAPVQPAASGDDTGAGPLDSILTTKKQAWINARLKEQQIKPKSPGYGAKFKEAGEAYEQELNKALAKAPFDVFANHPVNAGVPKGDMLKQAHEALRDEFGVADEVPKSTETIKQRSSNTGAWTVEQRKQNAANSFKESVIEQFGLSDDEAQKAFDYYLRNKLIKLNSGTGQFNLSDGRLWDASALKKAAKDQQKPDKQAKNKTAINDGDDILTAIAKLGGLNAAEAKAQGIDPASFKLRGHGIKRVFNHGKNSKSYDSMAEALREQGFDVPMANDLVELVSGAVNQGRKIYTAKGAELQAEIMAQEHVSEQEAQHVLRIESLYEIAKQHDADFGTNYLETVLKLDDLSTDNLSEWEQDLEADRKARQQKTDDDSQTPVSGETELQSYTEQEIADREREQKQRDKQAQTDELKARQKEKVDKEIDTLADEMLGNIGTNDIFGMASPMDKPDSRSQPADRSERMKLRATTGPTAVDVGDGIRQTNERIELLRSGIAGAEVDAINADAEPVTADTETQSESVDPSSPIDAFKLIMQGLNEGAISIDEYKKGFEALVANKETVEDELSKQTKAKLLESGYISYYHKNEKKEFLVHQTYKGMLADFFISDDLLSYGMGKDSYVNAIRNNVESLTQDDLDSYAEKRKKAIEDRKQEIAEKIEGVKDPKTLDDFQNYMRVKIQDEKLSFADARMTLTPEQRAKYDKLVATKSRQDRSYRKERDTDYVATNRAETDAEIVKTVHTRDNYDLWVVKAADRVEREIYNDWNATAKKLGGWYSSFKGRGATPGFQFKTEESAQAFQQYISKGDKEAVQEQAKARRDAYQDDKTQGTVERLTEMADRLDEAANESLSQVRKTNTARRANMAAGSDAKARGQIALAQTMKNIAGAISSGSANFLDRVRQKVQVEFLQSMVGSAHYRQLMDEAKGSYGEYEKRKYEAPTQVTADYAEFPSYSAYRSDLANLARQLVETDGTKQLGKDLLKVADDVTDAYLKFAKENLIQVGGFRTKDGDIAAFSSMKQAELSIAASGYNGKAIPFKVSAREIMPILSPSEAQIRGIWKGDNDKRITLNRAFGDKLIAALGKANRKQQKISVPWQFERAHSDLARLQKMGIESPAEFRAALREFIDLKEQPAQEDKIKKLERSMVGRANDGLDFFPTPQSVADEMIAAADIQEGMKVLEPSAGMGHIADQIRDAGVDPDVIELSGNRRELLEAKGHNIVAHDFMDYNEGGYDRIIMNPPFSDRRDAAHVQHAYGLLKPGGRLVAIMGEGVFFGSDKKASSFMDWLDSVGGEHEKMPENTFMDKSLPVTTGVNTRMVVIEKPLSKEATNDIKFSKNDTETGQFLDGRARPLHREVFDNIREGVDSEGARAARAGAATTRQGILIQSTVSSESGERSGVLEHVLHRDRALDKGSDLGSASSPNTPKTGTSVDELRSWLPKRVNKLVEANKLHIVQSAREIPDNAQAFEAAGAEAFYKISTDELFMIADNITKENFKSVLNHELFHRLEFTDKRLREEIAFFDNALERRFNLAAKGGGSKIEKAAYRRVMDAHVHESDYLTEFKAYLVSEYSRDPDTFFGTIKKIIQDFIAAIRAAMIRVGVPVQMLTPADLTALAKYSARVKDGVSQSSNSDIHYSRAAQDSATVAAAKRKAGLGPKRTLAQAIQDIISLGWSANAQAIKDRWQALKPQLEQGVFDKFLGIKLAEQEILGEVAHSQSGYIGARLSTGSSSTMQGLLLFGSPEWRDGIIQKKAESKGFAEILQPVKDDIENFTAWMVGRRADRLYREGKENNFTRAEIDALLALKQDSYQGVADDIAAMNKAVLDLAQESGLVDAQSRRLFEHSDYIPFFRLVEGVQKGPRNKQGLSHQTSGIKALKGGENPLSDPLGNMMQNWAHLIDASMKNDALNKTLTNLEGSRFVEPIPRVEFKQAMIPKEQIRKLMQEAGLPDEIIDAMPGSLTSGIAKLWAMQAPTDPDVVRVMRDGKSEYFRVHDGMLLTSLIAVNQSQLGGIFKSMRYMKHLLTAAITADPTFMARNFIRDSMHSWTIAEEKGFKLGLDSFHGAIKSMKEEGGYVDMMFAGASFQGGYGNYNNPDSARESMDAALRRRGIHDIQGFHDSILDTPKKYWEMYRSVGDAIENANREAILENVKRSGAEKAQYLFEAKDIMDFSMQGSFTLIRAMSDMLPFFNARLVGLYRLAKAGKTDQARRLIIAKGLSISFMTLALLALNSDNEDYEALEDFDKDQYWHFFIGDQHYRIPKPFELGLIFGTVPERAARAMIGKDTLKDFGKRMAHGAGDTLAFNPVPQLFKPFVELYSNKNMFTGRPIEGMADEGKLPSARYNEYTSETMRVLSSVLPESLGASPKRLEHLMSGYLGAMGMYALGVSDMMVRSMADMPELPEQRIDRLPVIKGFYQEQPALHTKYGTQLYEMLSEVNQIHRTINAYKKEGNIDKARELLQENASKLRSRKALDKSSKSLSEIRKRIDAIYRSDLGAEEKRRRIDALMMQANKGVQRVVRATSPYFN